MITIEENGVKRPMTLEDLPKVEAALGRAPSEADGPVGRVGSGDLFSRLVGAALTPVGLLFAWTAGEVTQDKWSYVAFGVMLMLWPVQWAFYLGKKQGRENVLGEPQTRA